MRHKQRPVKSSRHKSVTFIIDSQATTSFGDTQQNVSFSNIRSATTKDLSNNSPYSLQHLQQQQQQRHHNPKPTYHQTYSPAPLSPNPYPPQPRSLSPSSFYYGSQANKSALGGIAAAAAAAAAAATSSSRQVANQRNRRQTGSHNQTQPSSSGFYQPFVGGSTSKAMALECDDNDDNPLLRKQFEHNYRHMSDVMRLAFLENNDLPIDDCSNIDFNSLSTASILQRNIQQHLQQERRNQLQMRQQRFHNFQQQHQQNNLHDNNHQHHNQIMQHDMLQGNNNDDDIGYYDDNNYEMSDSKIFATANTPNHVHHSNDTQNYRTSSNSFRPAVEQAAGMSGLGLQQRHNVGPSPGKKRTSKTQPNKSSSSAAHNESSSWAYSQDNNVDNNCNHQEEIIQNLGDGFLCDEPGCGKSFPSLRKLRHHKVVHSDEFPYVCEFNGCAKKFKRKFGIDLHSTTHFDLDPEMYTKTSNNSSLPFFGRRMQYSMCKPCNEKFKTVHEYQYHMLKHGKEPFKCPVKGCGQTFSIWKSFQKHRASHYFNYYCKMDPAKCDHHTSNLQLLKLHIYCCHFQRKLPENATLASRDTEVAKPEWQDCDNEDQPSQSMEEGGDEDENEKHEDSSIMEEVNQEESSPIKTEPEPEPTTPRRDSRLRKNPPRFSSYGQLDYASINNGASFAKAIASTPPPKRLRTSGGSQNVGSQSISPRDRKAKQQNQQNHEHSDFRDGDLQDDHRLLQHDVMHNASNDDDISDYEDTNYEMSDSKIFATANVGPSSSKKRTSKTQSNKSSSHNESSSWGFSGDNNIDNSRDNSNQEEAIQNLGDGYLCDEPGCGKSFPSVRKLRHHKVVHSDDFPYVCEFKGCTKKFKRKFGIDLHSTTHFDLDPDMYSKTSNNSSLPFFGRRMQYSMCKPCNEKFKTVHEYQYHMLKHGKEPFKCPVKGCGITFGIWKSFQKHRASHYFNYYCKMDPAKCDHHTSNLQLLKLHIYCCHFQRKLPENATLASRDTEVAKPEWQDCDNEDQPSHLTVEGGEENELDKQEESSIAEDVDKGRSSTIKTEPETEPEAEPEAEPTTPRRDSRLRKNPPRFSTYGQLDYASINNGASFAKATNSTPPSKRLRASGSSQNNNNSQSVSPRDRKVKQQQPQSLPTKVLPKRSAQRLPMSLIAADDASTEDDGQSSDGESSHHNDKDDDGRETNSSKKTMFNCHMCDYRFSVRFQLTKHLSTHLELTPEMYSATADKQVVQLSERRRREFYCDECNVRYDSMQNLDNHMKKHGPRPYVCSFCQNETTFRMAKQYLSHLYEHRFNYKCTMAPDCDFTINRKDALKLHIFRMHLNQQLPSYIENFANMLSPDHNSTY